MVSECDGFQNLQKEFQLVREGEPLSMAVVVYPNAINVFEYQVRLSPWCAACIKQTGYVRMPKSI